MRGDLTYKILEILAGAALNAVGVIEAILNAGYGASTGKMMYELNKIQNRQGAADLIKNNERKERQNFHSMMTKLQKDGLISRESKEKNSKLKITSKGKTYFSILKNNRLESAKRMLPPTHYDDIEPGKFTIVAFDIPEAEKRKRNWLRESLKNMEFQFVQKSVWFGRNKIPERFMQNLRKLELMDFVEIFEITKTGTLKKINESN